MKITFTYASASFDIVSVTYASEFITMQGCQWHIFLHAQTFLSDILIAVNPYKKLAIYGNDVHASLH